MKTTLKTLSFAVSAGVLAAATPALASTIITGEVSSVNSNAGSGLIINAAPIAFPSFMLDNVGDSAVFDVLRVGTPEGTVNLDDLFPQSITANFTFSSPFGTGPDSISGATFGFIVPFTQCGILAGGCGAVNWGGPTVFDFGGGGQFSVELSDAIFRTPGAANVQGRFTLLSAAVPEPSTWMLLILGFGLVGGAMRSSKKQTLAVSYS